MAAATAVPSSNATQKHNVPRRKRLVGQRRRVGEDDGSDDHDGRGDSAVDLINDGCLTDGSTASDERDPVATSSDTGRVDDALPSRPASGRKGPASRDNKRGPKQGLGHGQGHGTVASARVPRRPSSAAESRASDAVPRSDAVSAVVAAARRAESTPPSRQQLAASTTATAATTNPKASSNAMSKAPSEATSSAAPTPAPKAPQPPIVSSSAAATPAATPPGSAGAQQPRRESAYEKQRREHDLYKQRRDEDPAFVPNRGAFFMHDHRGAGPSANGFRPFARPGRGGRGGRGGFAATFAPMHNQFQNQADPTVNAPWAHDMHDTVARPNASRVAIAPRRQNFDTSSQYGGSQMSITVPPSVNTIPTCPSSDVPINRSMSVEKQLGTMTIRAFFPPLKEPITFEKFKVMQYTKLPDHRPPLRRDKAVIIDLPGHPKFQKFPAVDRSFIFIPRALRPNQQRSRGGRTRSVMGSISGFSRRTSMYGGSYYNGSIYNGSVYNGSVYNGSVYTPSVAPSRRSSIAQDAVRDFIISPTSSSFSRPQMTMDNTAGRPVVRLPPSANFGNQLQQPMGPGPMPMLVNMPPFSHAPQPFQHPQSYPPPFTQPPHHQQQQQYRPQPGPPPPSQAPQAPAPQPQNHPLPPRPPYQETRPSQNLPMHQPRPQKAVSLENIEAPVNASTVHNQPYSNAFHQQMPIQMASNGYPLSAESHSRHPSSSQPPHSTGTPLSQIPERAIHAAPFQPTNASQHAAPAAQAGPPAYYGAPGGNYTVMQSTPQQPYYYSTPNVPGAGGYMPAPPPQGPVPTTYNQGDVSGTASSAAPQNMMAQEINGMVYYMNAPQVQPSYPAYQQPAAPMHGGYMPGGMNGMVAPAPTDQYYYGPMYYSQ
ncbi:hypothetical protein F503_00977 [Ophiostoma piceae UAMH 11346]|uniref:Btz domain-containing protein n=1 Tax=Ophiostoma piceae (strain UAMH 11346) TaxID=1262450 RepID=S3C3X7_OPHP1|nr:hypothetical protein F503_00977 [Ophiostoma piceae UAMH 11346]